MSSSFDFPELTELPPPAEAESDAGGAGGAEAKAAAARTEAFEAGRAAGRAEIRPAREALAAAARELVAERERVSEETERAAVELALSIAEKVLGAAIEVRPELVVDGVRGALRRLIEPQESVVLVSPQDLALVREALDGLAAELGAPLRARAEQRVAPGGCVIRTQVGEVDARIATQLERARAIAEAELQR